MALDKKPDDVVSEADNSVSPSPNLVDDETDTDFHETLPREVLKMKDIIVLKHGERKKRSNVEFTNELKQQTPGDSLKVAYDKREEFDCFSKTPIVVPVSEQNYSNTNQHEVSKDKTVKEKRIGDKQTSESSVQSKQDSIGSVIPVITISTTESDDEILHTKNEKGKEDNVKEKKRKDNKAEGSIDKGNKQTTGSSEVKLLRRQSSVDSASEHKIFKEKKPNDGHKFQYSL